MLEGAGEQLILGLKEEDGLEVVANTLLDKLLVTIAILKSFFV